MFFWIINQVIFNALVIVNIRDVALSAGLEKCPCLPIVFLFGVFVFF